jgi:hypothetical protein
MIIFNNIILLQPSLKNIYISPLPNKSLQRLAQNQLFTHLFFRVKLKQFNLFAF